MDQFILAAKHNAPGVWLRSSRRTGPRLIGISRYITLIGINAKIPRLIVRFKNRRPLRVRHRPPVSQGDGRLFCTTQLLIWQKRAVAGITDFFGFDRSCLRARAAALSPRRMGAWSQRRQTMPAASRSPIQSFETSRKLTAPPRVRPPHRRRRTRRPYASHPASAAPQSCASVR